MIRIRLKKGTIIRSTITDGHGNIIRPKALKRSAFNGTSERRRKIPTAAQLIAAENKQRSGEMRSSLGGTIRVKGFTKADGTRVKGHTRRK